MVTTPELQGSALVMRGDEVVLEIHDGLADRSTGARNSASTRYQIASVSKQFAAAAVLMLVERGQVVLHDPIGPWFDGGSEQWRAITLHQLLTHTSGVGHWESYPMIDVVGETDPEEFLSILRTVPLRDDPGEYHYSSPGYALLAYVVQRAADQPFRDFLADRVFGPLGLDRTFVGAAGNRPDVARGYDGDAPVRPVDLDTALMGGGDISSTVGDLLIWMDQLTAGALISTESLRLMITPYVPTAVEGRSYGYGWFIGSLAGGPHIHHTGDNTGFKAYDAWLPASNSRVIMLSNQDVADSKLVDHLLALASGAEPAV